MRLEDALQEVEAASQKLFDRHRDSVAWLSETGFPTALIWLNPAWAAEPERAALRKLLPHPRIQRRIESHLMSGKPAHARRAAYALCDRLALPVAVRQLMRGTSPNPLPSASSGQALSKKGVRLGEGTDSCPSSPLPLARGEGPGVRGALPNDPTTQRPNDPTTQRPNDYSLMHTAMGQPIVRGMRDRGLHISYSHDGGAHLTVAARDSRLLGVGIDIVHLPRLRGDRRDRAYVERFARHFMSAEEYAVFLSAGTGEEPDAFSQRGAAHFSLMEAASKALGTGLKIGGGMGGPASLPKQSLGVLDLQPEVEFIIGPEARSRIARLGGGPLKGYWGTDGEYLVSAAFLWKVEDRR